LLHDTTTLQTMMPTTMTMLMTMPLTTKTENTNKTANPVPLQRIDLDVLKASILAGLIRNTTAFQMTMPLTQPMPMMQPMKTMQPTTMMPENTKMTTNTMPSNPARSTVTAPTPHKPQQLPQTTINATDDAATNYPAMILTPMMQPPMTMTTYNVMTEKPKTSNIPATASTFTNHNDHCNIPTMTRTTLMRNSRQCYQQQCH